MRQEYDKYTAEDHEVWSILYARQMETLPKVATQAYLDGIKKVKFEPNLVPNFDVINEELGKTTGWEVYPVPGIIDNKPFFEHLSRKEFPATTWLRKRAQLDYIEQPDMFHDVFGHVPLLIEQFFCDFLEGLSHIALKYIDNPTIVELVTRCYWYTVEFGLIQEQGQTKIYGAGILSSPGESIYCLSDEAIRLPFNIDQIFETRYVKEGYQSQYFITDSYQQLFETLPHIEATADRYAKEGIEIELSYPLVDKM